jgi:nucleoside-diphosphate-sugar epimerase
VLVTGANGFVGRALCTEAVRCGLHVRGAVRSVCELPVGAEPAIVGAIGSETSWADALRGVDVVIHLAARVHVMSDIVADPLAEFRLVNTAGTEHLARFATANGVKRLVYVSSIKVNGEATYGDKKFTVADVPAPQDPYGVSKWEAEQVLRRIADETGLEVVIVRPPLVYGPGVKGNFAQMLGVVAKRIPLPFASIHNRRSLIYVGNLTDALITCATHPAAAGQTYLVCDGEDISTPDLLRQLAGGMGIPSRLFHCPSVLLKLAGKLAGKSQQLERLLGSLRVDGDKMRADLNWTPPYTLRQGLQMTAAWHRTRHI